MGQQGANRYCPLHVRATVRSFVIARIRRAWRLPLARRHLGASGEPHDDEHCGKPINPEVRRRVMLAFGEGGANRIGAEQEVTSKRGEIERATLTDVSLTGSVYD